MCFYRGVVTRVYGECHCVTFVAEELDERREVRLRNRVKTYVENSRGLSLRTCGRSNDIQDFVLVQSFRYELPFVEVGGKRFTRLEYRHRCSRCDMGCRVNVT